MKIEKSNITDAKKLSHLTIQSKSYWDYSPEQIEIWKTDLTITEEYIHQNEVYQLVEKDNLIGYYSFFSLEKNSVKLDNIFIDPKFIGKGYGKILMDDFFKRVQQKGFEKVMLDADPNAENFYKKLGFKVIGKLETSIKDRFLPIMELTF